MYIQIRMDDAEPIVPIGGGEWQSFTAGSPYGDLEHWYNGAGLA